MVKNNRQQRSSTEVAIPSQELQRSAIIIDTNSYGSYKKLQPFARAGLRICIPAIVVYERAFNNVEEHKGRAPEQIQPPKPTAWGMPIGNMSVDLRRRVELEYKRLRQELIEAGVDCLEIQDIKSFAHLAAYTAAMKQYPFYDKTSKGKYTDAGFKDFIVLYSALEVSKDRDVIILTADKGLRGIPIDQPIQHYLPPFEAAFMHGFSGRIRIVTTIDELLGILGDDRPPLEVLLDPRVRTTLEPRSQQAVADAFFVALNKWNLSKQALGIDLNVTNVRISAITKNLIQHIKTVRYRSQAPKMTGYISTFRVEADCIFDVLDQSLPTGMLDSITHENLVIEGPGDPYRLRGTFRFELELVWEESWPYAREFEMIIREPKSGIQIRVSPQG